LNQTVIERMVHWEYRKEVFMKLVMLVHSAGNNNREWIQFFRKLPKYPL